jgi:hypothetical protein
MPTTSRLKNLDAIALSCSFFSLGSKNAFVSLSNTVRRPIGRIFLSASSKEMLVLLLKELSNCSYFAAGSSLRDPRPTATVQVVVERAAHRLLIQPEEDMDAWRLDVCIDHRDALTLLNQAASQIGGQVGFAGASAEGVNGNDGRHAVGSSCTSFEVEFPPEYVTSVIAA